MQYQHVLAYLPPRVETAVGLDWAMCVARAHGARVTALDVVEAPAEPRSALRDHVITLDLEAHRRALEERLAPYQDGPERIEALLTVGKPSLEILRQVARGRHDLVVKAARGRDHGRPTLFGSTGMHLVRKCPAPVWLTGHRPPRDRRGILAAVDPGPRGDVYRRALALKVLRHAEGLASTLSVPLHVAHVVHFPGLARVRSHAGPDIERAAADEVEEARRVVTAIVDETLVRSPASIRVSLGEPEVELSLLATALDVDVVVLGSVGRSGISGLLIGEMAEDLLARMATSGVLCIKPDGFELPLTHPTERSLADTTPSPIG
jgi:nucleotide-binding universal stress UspA family protein